MTVSVPVLVPVLAAAVALAAFAWIVYQYLPERVFLRDRTILKKYRRQIEQMLVAEIAEIKYHYHAVVGFIARWEFVDRNGNVLSMDSDAKGIDDVLTGLEKLLPGFSLVEFKRKFEDGDVEDSIDVWKAA